MNLYLRPNPAKPKYIEATDEQILQEAIRRIRSRGLVDLAEDITAALVSGALRHHPPLNSRQDQIREIIDPDEDPNIVRNTDGPTIVGPAPVEPPR